MRTTILSNVLTTAAALVLTPLAARAQSNACNSITGPITSPLATITVGGACQDISSFIQPVAGAKGLYQIVASQAFVLGGNTILFTPNATQFKVDPYINFGMTTTGAGTYTFAFYTPITPGQYTSALASGGLSVTDVSGNGTTVAQSGANPFIAAFGSSGNVLTNLGTNITGGACTVSAAGTQTCNYGTAKNSFQPAFYDNLEARLTYTQTGVGTASWSGGVSIAASTVPEPSTWALVGTGVVALAGMARRRRNA